MDKKGRAGLHPCMAFFVRIREVKMSKGFKQEAEEELERLKELQDADVQRLNALQAEEVELSNKIVERRGAIQTLQKLLEVEKPKPKKDVKPE